MRPALSVGRRRPTPANPAIPASPTSRKTASAQQVGHVGVLLGHVPGIEQHRRVALQVRAVGEECRGFGRDIPGCCRGTLLHNEGKAVGGISTAHIRAVMSLLAVVVVVPVSRGAGRVEQQEPPVLSAGCRCVQGEITSRQAAVASAPHRNV